MHFLCKLTHKPKMSARVGRRNQQTDSTVFKLLYPLYIMIIGQVTTSSSDLASCNNLKWSILWALAGQEEYIVSCHPLEAGHRHIAYKLTHTGLTQGYGAVKVSILDHRHFLSSSYKGQGWNIILWKCLWQYLRKVSSIHCQYHVSDIVAHGLIMA